jgi:MYXO-CTERM domain-containing protein
MRIRTPALTGMFVACLAASERARGALPTFQTYIDGAVAGTNGGDQQTWFATGSSFDLFVVGSYGPNDISISSTTLLLSVPQGETGTISISAKGSDETPILVSTIGGVTASPINPSTNADLDMLTDIGGLDGYSDKSFLPAGVTFNNHYPFQAGVSDFLLFDIAAFDTSETGLNDYNADGGTITNSPNAIGEQKEYTVSFTGFSQVHFDVYGMVMTATGPQIRTTWDINPGSHDSTALVPAPGAAALALIGIGLSARRRRRNA